MYDAPTEFGNLAPETIVGSSETSAADNYGIIAQLLGLKPQYCPEPKPRNFQTELNQGCEVIHDLAPDLHQHAADKYDIDLNLDAIEQGEKHSDDGKIGPHLPTAPEFNPNNVVARIYREIRWGEFQKNWIKTHPDDAQEILGKIGLHSDELISNGKGRNLLPLAIAMEITKHAATDLYRQNNSLTETITDEKHLQRLAEIDQIFSLTKQDHDSLTSLGVDPENDSLAVVFTKLHLRAGEQLLKALNVPDEIINLALSHHFSAGEKFIPKETLNRIKTHEGKALQSYFVGVAILEIIDRTQGYINGSNIEDPQAAFSETRKVILDNLNKNYLSSPHFPVIQETYLDMFTFFSEKNLPGLLAASN